MIPSPILKALSTIRRRHADHLLMGGQACVLYGAVEFSRDIDLALLSDAANLDRLQAALDDLDAEVIAVPPFLPEHLAEGLAIHFRCAHPDASGLPIDVMTKLRGVDPFPDLWERRTTYELDSGTLQVLSLPDLVKAKKTQRDRDWPVIRRLVDANYTTYRDEATPEQIAFWLMELRTPEFLVGVAEAHPDLLDDLRSARPVLELATSEGLDEGTLARALRNEEDHERDADAAYWRPLREKLSRLRREARRGW